MGNSARRVLIETPERVIYSVKRLMGRGLEEVQSELKLFPFRLADDVEAGEVPRIQLGELAIHSTRDFGLYSAPAQAQCRAVLWLAGYASRDHCAGLLQ